MLVNIRNMLLAAFFIGIIVSSKVSLSFTLGSAVGFSLFSTLFAIVLFCIPAGLYWLFKQKMLPSSGVWLWIIWTIVAIVLISFIVSQRLVTQHPEIEQTTATT